MVNRSREHNEESLVPQGAERVIPEPNKIGAFHTVRLRRQESNCIWRLVTGSHPAGKAGIPETGGRNIEGRAHSASDDHLSIHLRHGAGGLRWLYATESPPLCRARTHVYWGLASVAAAATVHVLEVSGVAALADSASTIGHPATDATTGVGAANVQLSSVTLDTDTTV